CPFHLRRLAAACTWRLHGTRHTPPVNQTGLVGISDSILVRYSSVSKRSVASQRDLATSFTLDTFLSSSSSADDRNRHGVLSGDWACFLAKEIHKERRIR